METNRATDSQTPNVPVGARLLAAMPETRAYQVSELLAALPAVRASTLAVELKRLVEAGRLVRLSRGVYARPVGEPRPRSGRTPVGAWVEARAPGVRFSVYDAMAGTGASYAAADRLLRARSAEGRLLRLGGGLYAAPAAEGTGEAARPRAKSEAIRRLMASEDRAWRAREIQELIGGAIAPSSALPLLVNMARRGTVERAAPGEYRLVGPRGPRARTARIEDLARTLEGVLARGSLWRVSDLVAEAGAPRTQVEDALRRLSGAGRAVHVVLNHWRSAGVSTDLVRDGRTVLARALGVLLRGGAVGVGEAASVLGVTAVEVSARMRTLRLQDLAVEDGRGVYRCPPEVLDTVVPLLAPPGATRAA